MKLITATLIVSLFTGSLFGQSNAYKVKYTGGNVPDLKNGSEVALAINGTDLIVTKGKKTIQTIPASNITELSYGQDVNRRIGTAAALATVSLGVGAIVAFSKSKKHFVGLTWNGGGMVLQADKKDYRGLLAALEGTTGLKAVDTDKKQ